MIDIVCNMSCSHMNPSCVLHILAPYLQQRRKWLVKFSLHPELQPRVVYRHIKSAEVSKHKAVLLFFMVRVELVPTSLRVGVTCTDW